MRSSTSCPRGGSARQLAADRGSLGPMDTHAAARMLLLIRLFQHATRYGVRAWWHREAADAYFDSIANGAADRWRFQSLQGLAGLAHTVPAAGHRARGI